MYLRCLAGDRPKSWIKWLLWAEFCYNTSNQTAIKYTPFQVVYGRAPPALLSDQPGSAQMAAVDRQLLDKDEFMGEIWEQLLQALVTMKQYQDQYHRQAEFA
jgi:hypothetical protein